MSLPPFDGTGWIVGMPGLPGGVPLGTLTGPSAAVVGVPATFNLTTDAPQSTADVWLAPNNWTMSQTGDFDGTKWTVAGSFATAGPIQVQAFLNSAPGVRSNTIAVAVTEPLTIVATTDRPDGTLPVGSPAFTVTVTASADPPSPVALFFTVNGGAAVESGDMYGESATVFSGGIGTGAGVVGDVYDAWATTPGAADSNHVTVTVVAPAADPSMGWTKAELIEFAADHEPPIDVPASGTKAEILAAILAYIQSHPEEN